MNEYRFSICGLAIQVTSERQIKIDDSSLLFWSDQIPLISASIHLVDTLTLPQCASLGDNSLRTVWRQGVQVTRCCSLYSSIGPCIRADYRVNSPGIVDCVISKENWLSLSNMQQLWPGIMLNYLLLPYRTLIFHASYIGYREQGILFTAPSGTGKSTQAELWRVHRGARVLNGDKAGVTLRETPMAHGLPFSGTSNICENVSLPLRAIVVLSQAPVNAIRRLRPSEAVAALCSNLFVDQVISEEWNLALNLLLDLVASVPVYALACTPDERAVQTLEQVLKP